MSGFPSRCRIDLSGRACEPDAITADPADRITLDESIDMALLVVLDSMTPAERVAFLLHDVFRYPFAEVAEIVGRTPAACRQLATSARRRVRAAQPSATPTPQRAGVVRAFKQAWDAKDIGALINVLDPSASLVADGGGLVPAALQPIEGGDVIAQYLVELAERAPGELALVERTVNGQPGLVGTQDGVTATESEGQNRRLLICVLGVAALMRAALVFAPPDSTDIYRYVWDGRVQANGINPYLYVPADPALSHLRDGSIYPDINRKEYAPTIYPPMAQIVYFLASRVSETVSMMKLAMLAFEALAIWALIQLLAARGLPTMLAGIYALHPLPIWEIAGSGHVDIIPVAFIWLALLAAEKGQRFASGIGLAAAVLSKYFPIVLTPAIYRRWDWKMPLAFAATVAALYLPYISAGKKVFGFLGGYAGEELKAGDGIYIVQLLKVAGFGATALPIFLALVVLTLGVLAWRSGFRATPDKPDLHGAFAIATAFAVFFSPHYPWYFIWLIPFLCFFPSLAVFWLTLSATALYWVPWPIGPLGASVLYVPFAALLIFENLKPFSAKESSNGRAIA